MIEGSWCEACGRVSVPVETSCLVCRTETSPVRLPPRGRVLARTRLRGEEAWVVLVMLAEGARVLAAVEDEPRVGDACVVEVEAGEVSIRHVGEEDGVDEGIERG